MPVVPKGLTESGLKMNGCNKQIAIALKVDPIISNREIVEEIRGELLLYQEMSCR